MLNAQLSPLNTTFILLLESECTQGVKNILLCECCLKLVRAVNLLNALPLQTPIDFQLSILLQHSKTILS